jgi:hypothetical protein
MLGIPAHTVRNYVSGILTKTQLRNRTELGALVGEIRTRIELDPSSFGSALGRQHRRSRTDGTSRSWTVRATFESVAPSHPPTCPSHNAAATWREQDPTVVYGSLPPP